MSEVDYSELWATLEEQLDLAASDSSAGGFSPLRNRFCGLWILHGSRLLMQMCWTALCSTMQNQTRSDY